MRLAVGARLGSYEILSALGAGGMGEVYRARDTQLDREVAIKVLPQTFVADTERVARFEREAKVLASLNHPHIAGVYGLDEADGVRALVMELVEGDDLAERLTRGPIPLDEALAIAKQVAEALEAAHEHSVIHRDLKPANIKLRPDGTAKVLDFGLAKAMEPAGASSMDAIASPTITSPALMTGIGVLLGTAAYMSPEQARGKGVDKRSDIWAFGCVMYEMLTGKRAFDGEDMTDVLGAVVRLEPDWNAVPSDVPPAVRTLLRACLVKDRRQRVGDMSTVLFVVANTASLDATAPGEAQAATLGSGKAAKQSWRRMVATAAAALVAGAALAQWYFRRAPTAATTGQAPVRLSLVPAADVALAAGVNQLVPVVSPDGRRVAFSASRPGEPIRIWVRSLDSLDARPLPGTDNARGPFWSPDSGSLAFFSDSKLKTIDASGGPVQTVSEVRQHSTIRGASWSRTGTILFAGRTGGLMKVTAGGGEPTPATVVDTTNGDASHAFPTFLPDGRQFLYVSRPSNTLWLGTLDSREATRLFSSDSQAFYADGYILFARQGTLLAQPYDVGRATLAGAPTPIADRLAVDPIVGASAFSSSETGVLVYRTGAGSSQTQLLWVDRAGNEISKIGKADRYRNPELSNDGTRIALEAADSGNRTQDLSILDLPGGAASRFTVDRGNDVYPVWSPDDSRIAFGSDRQGGIYKLYEKMSNGSPGEKLLLPSTGAPDLNGPWDWSPDGKWLLFRNMSPETGIANTGILSLSGDPAIRNLFPRSDFFHQSSAQISPNGRWVAYHSSETGRFEVYVARFPNPSGGQPISTGGATHPRWGDDSRELFYYAADGRIMAVPISGTTTLEVGTPDPLFTARLLGGPAAVAGFRAQYDVSAKGQRFLLNVPVDETPEFTAITVVLHWTAGLRK